MGGLCFVQERSDEAVEIKHRLKSGIGLEAAAIDQREQRRRRNPLIGDARRGT